MFFWHQHLRGKGALIPRVFVTVAAGKQLFAHNVPVFGMGPSDSPLRSLVVGASSSLLFTCTKSKSYAFSSGAFLGADTDAVPARFSLCNLSQLIASQGQQLVEGWSAIFLPSYDMTGFFLFRLPIPVSSGPPPSQGKG